MGGTLQEKAKDQQSNLARVFVLIQVSSPAVILRPTREKTPEWAKSLLPAQKSSDVRLEKLEKVIKHHGQ